MSYRMSPWRSTISSFIASLSGPIDSPSPKTSSVTPWRMSLCDRPSSISDSLAQHIMLMKPGATARPVTSISTGARGAADVAQRRDLVAAERHVAHVGLAAAAVVDRAAAQDDVVRGRRRARGQQRAKGEGSEDRTHERSVRDHGSPPGIRAFCIIRLANLCNIFTVPQDRLGDTRRPSI